MDISFQQGALLVVTGLIAGVINTLAGGGSNLTLPALMVMGMPADLANATNRVGVFLQNVVALKGFKKYGKLPTGDLSAIVLPTLIGGAIGAIAAAHLPNTLLKPLLLLTMLALSVVILVRPGVISPPEGTIPYTVKQKPTAWCWLLLAGVYGGFVQAGVGFILITAVAGTLRYDLVRTNAIKVLCLVGFTGLALAMFIYRGQVLWLPGLVLASGTMVGAHFAVRFSITAKPQTLKWFLFVMTLCACAAAMWF